MRPRSTCGRCPRGSSRTAPRSFRLAHPTSRAQQRRSGDPPAPSTLTNVMLFWLNGTAGSAARHYYGNTHGGQLGPPPSPTPIGVAVFAEDIAIRRYGEPERQHRPLVGLRPGRPLRRPGCPRPPRPPPCASSSGASDNHRREHPTPLAAFSIARWDRRRRGCTHQSGLARKLAGVLDGHARFPESRCKVSTARTTACHPMRASLALTRTRSLARAIESPRHASGPSCDCREGSPGLRR